MKRADTFDHFPEPPESIDYRYDIYAGVWPEAAILRRSGALLALGRNITCPVTAIHGDYDPHPTQGVKEPLRGVLTEFKFILLKDCGHKPWIERAARDGFYKLLRREITG